MRSTWIYAAMLFPGMAVALAVSGCGSGEPTKPKVSRAPAVTLEVDGYTGEISGVILYGGPMPPKETEENILDKSNPLKKDDYAACHPNDKKVAGKGWYLNSETGGLQNTVVFLQAPDGADMPEVKKEHMEQPAEKNKPIKQPYCQFVPRVTVLHPKQNIDVYNDSVKPVNHDTKLTGASSNSITSPPGDNKVLPINESNDEWTALSCGAHPNIMSGFVWKFKHPYAAVTDDKGNFKLVGGPVLKGDQVMEIWAWHEMLPNQKPIRIGTLKGAKKDEAFTAKDLDKLK